MSKDVRPRAATGSVERRTDLERFEQMILDQLADAGLPNEDQNAFWGDGNWPKIVDFLERSS